jgi:YesN/AraC family two-component response regulator
MADMDLFQKAKLMAEFITEYYRNPLSVHQVAETVDLPPDHASKLFQMYFQYSIEDYITKYRIAYAQTLLITTDYSPSAIAPRAGLIPSGILFRSSKMPAVILPELIVHYIQSSEPPLSL